MKDFTNRTFIRTQDEVVKALGIKLKKDEFVDFMIVRESDDNLVIGTSDYLEE